MKKLLFSAAFAVTGLMFGQQITLENTFATGERAFAFAKGTDMVYVNLVSGTNTLKIYNSSFALIKTVNIPVSTDYIASLWYDSGQDSYPISKNIFNTDDKLEFLVSVGKYTTTTHRKLILMNEDGLLIKDFNPDITVSYSGEYAVFHDTVSNTNKIMIENETANDQSIYKVFSLPTTVLATKEIQNQAKLAAFPIPASKTLTITNPGNGSNKVEVYDMTGKIVLNKFFGSSDNTVSIDVESLTKGTYFYKIGELSSKFIKN